MRGIIGLLIVGALLLTAAPAQGDRLAGAKDAEEMGIGFRVFFAEIS